MKTAEKTRSRKLLGALIGAVALLGLAAPASALAAPVLDLSSTRAPSSGQVPAGTYANYELVVRNIGDAATAGAVEVDLTAPAGFRVVEVRDPLGDFIGEQFGIPVPMWDCAIAPGAQSVGCDGVDTAGNLGFFGLGTPIPISPGGGACEDLGLGPCPVVVTLKADESAPLGAANVSIEACNASATPNCDSADDLLEIVPFEFDIASSEGEFLKQNGDPATEAGSRPHTASSTFFLNTALDARGGTVATAKLKDAIAQLPPGLLGDPTVPACPINTFDSNAGDECPLGSQVGFVKIWAGKVPGLASTPLYKALFNLEPPKGTPALFGFNFEGFPFFISAKLRTSSDYGVTLIAKNTPQTLASTLDRSINGFTAIFWGVPADPEHDEVRGFHDDSPIPCVDPDPQHGLCDNHPSPAPLEPFVTLPTSCTGDPLGVLLDVTAWGGGVASDSFDFPAVEDCAPLDFAPTLKARPTTNVADSPTGLEVDLEVPQNDDCELNASPPPTINCDRATAHLRDTTVTLPEGLVINPSGANGLDGCSSAEIGLTTPLGSTPIHFTENSARCPNASKVASVQVDTPLLDHPVEGSVYIADPFDNPFRSLIAIYIALDDPQSGVVAKLAGHVVPDPNTGQLVTTFADNPQLPFEHFRLNFFGGAGAQLKTPASCGDYTTTSSMTPWSAPDTGPPDTPSDTWTIVQGPQGDCSQPNAPFFDAGTVSPIANAHSPFVMRLRRDDGSQQFSAITVSPPQGLVAKLAGTEICPQSALDAAAAKTGAGEKASPSCPAASEVGDVTAGAGAGPAPYHAPGKVYMAGPYKGAPLSFAIVTPATAGPFDLGTVVVRTAIHVDPRTAMITAVSDPLPSILDGIPLDVRTVDLSLDKPEFTLNGTSCDPSAVTGQLTSLLGQVANLEARFQLGECQELGFKPRMALRLKGGTKRGKHPQLTAFVLPRAGDANIRSVSVAFPRSEFLENAHIRTICTRPDFAADNCPAGAIYGSSTVFTPLLDYPLTGNVYLRSSDNLLPDVVPDLRGPAHQPIKVEAAGRTDSIRGGIRNTFDFFPDAPFTRAVLRMQGGNKGLLVNSRNICAKTYRATVRFTGHNGARHTIRPKLVAQNCKKKRRKKAKRSSHSRSKGIALRSAVR